MLMMIVIKVMIIIIIVMIIIITAFITRDDPSYSEQFKRGIGVVGYYICEQSMGIIYVNSQSMKLLNM